MNDIDKYPLENVDELLLSSLENSNANLRREEGPLKNSVEESKDCFLSINRERYDETFACPFNIIENLEKEEEDHSEITEEESHKEEEM